ncbi:MAG: hypothetical protein IPM69_02215 [Ignavibacteria bacterium]|nr:hypothetical protein [Ignavibacteria bacterium]
MLDNINPATREEIPRNLNWGDKIDVTIVKVMSYGIYFEYNHILGFIDHGRITHKDYIDFHNGTIKPGDSYSIRIGIIEFLDLTYPNQGTFLLVVINDDDEINQRKQNMLLFGSKFKVGDTFMGGISGKGNLGVHICRIDDNDANVILDPAIVGYFTTPKKQKELVEKLCVRASKFPVKIIEIDNQVLRIVVEIDWNTLSRNLEMEEFNTQV